MMWRISRTSTANWITERQFKSVCTTRLPMLRWTKSSPGIRPTISFAGTRLSEHPIQRYRGDCWCASFAKNAASDRRMRSAPARLFRKGSRSTSRLRDRFAPLACVAVRGDQSFNGRDVDRLLEMFLKAGCQRALALQGPAASRDGKDVSIVKTAFQFRRGFVAVHVRHADVEEHVLRIEAPCQIESVKRIGRVFDAMTGIAQQQGQRGHFVGVVVDDEYSFRCHQKTW